MALIGVHLYADPLAIGHESKVYGVDLESLNDSNSNSRGQYNLTNNISRDSKFTLLFRHANFKETNYMHEFEKQRSQWIP